MNRPRPIKMYGNTSKVSSPKMNKKTGGCGCGKKIKKR